jgi:hypothetical protein
VVPRVRGQNKGHVLKGCERSAGEGIVGEEVEEAEITGWLWGAWGQATRATALDLFFNCSCGNKK